MLCLRLHLITYTDTDNWDNVYNAVIVTVISIVHLCSSYECSMTASGCQLSDCCYHLHPPSSFSIAQANRVPTPPSHGSRRL